MSGAAMGLEESSEKVGHMTDSLAGADPERTISEHTENVRSLVEFTGLGRRTNLRPKDV